MCGCVDVDVDVDVDMDGWMNGWMNGWMDRCWMMDDGQMDVG